MSHGICIGQELATLEVKVNLVMAVSRLQISLAYAGLNRAEGSKAIMEVYGQWGCQIQ